ncbi:MAG: IS1634 family transposase [Candidatus Marinimicrobia bacterium]|nr:IS1634 family transposase [Candidatus Neomarinimicrobiota bacterium]
MFIKEILKKNKGYEKTFAYHRLMESYRTKSGPRQRTVLNLGSLTLDKTHWKTLADRIEQIVSGQASIFIPSQDIESLAQHYAQVLIQNRLSQSNLLKGTQTTETAIETDAELAARAEYVSVDVHSVTTSRVRTIGAEHVGLSIFKRLKIDKCLADNGFTENQVKLAAVSIIGKLVNPASERRTRSWARNVSALCELMDMNPNLLSNNSLYRISDSLLSVKDELEQHLYQREQDLFSLNDKILLYDLTNTYFEGLAQGNPKAKRGWSKEKRYDCPLLTLGMVVDSQGFPRVSKLLAGNVSEGKTLLGMIQTLQGAAVKLGSYSENSKGSEKAKQKTELELKTELEISKRGITVVLDAGVAIESNLKLLRSNGYDYIVVARNKPVAMTDIDFNKLTTIKETANDKVEVCLIEREDENILYCKSLKRLAKENAMQLQYQSRFEAGIELISASLMKKGGVKKAEKINERIGRLKERNSAIARFYSIDIKQQDGVVTSITWKFKQQEAQTDRFSGSYFLRSSRKALNEAALWKTYVMLTKVEEGFSCLKDDLKLRPIFHQKEQRSDGHMFITLLAYHLLNSIRVNLESEGIHQRWQNIRELLSTQALVTTAFNTENGQRIHIRQCSDPELFHRSIYNALKIKLTPL